MSTIYKNVQGGARTSSEAAAADQGLAEQRRTEPSELEATGELPNSFTLPVGTSTPARTFPGPPLFAATDITLAVKWGISDFEQVAAKGPANRRVTRGYATAVRQGNPPGQAREGEARTPKPKRAPKQAASQKQTERGEPQALALNLAESSKKVCSSNERTDEFQESNRDVQVVDDRRERQETSNSSDLIGDDAKDAGSGSQTENDGVWAVATTGAKSNAATRAMMTTKPVYFPTWFDLCTDKVPVLPDINAMEWSLLDEFISHMEAARERVDEEEAEALQRAMHESIRAAGEEQRRCETWEASSSTSAAIPAMALVVEIEEDNEPPAQQSEQQREFLRRFVSCEPANHDASPRERKRTDLLNGNQGRRKSSHQKPVLGFKREASQVPEGGWFSTTAAAGGRGPPDDSSSSSGSSSSSESSSSSSSASEDEDDSDSSSRSRNHKTDRGSRERRKKQAYRKKAHKDRRRMKQALAGVKIKPPFVWDGKADRVE